MLFHLIYKFTFMQKQTIIGIVNFCTHRKKCRYFYEDSYYNKPFLYALPLPKGTDRRIAERA